jgi:hypothetical protein
MSAARVLALNLAVSMCALVGGSLVLSASALAASAPVIEEESVSDVSASSATLRATLNPGGAETTYIFEEVVNGGAYEPIRGPEGEAVVGAEGSAGTGVTGVPLEAHVQGLTPKTSYRFRVVASNSVETVDGTDQVFTTQGIGGFALPDGRQWEMVSPPQKRGALIEPIKETGVIEASINGGAISYLANTPTETEPTAFTNRAQIFSTRGPDGWSSVDLAAPHKAATGASIGFGQEYRFFSEDLSLGLVQPFGSYMPLSEDASEQTPYLHADFAGEGANQPCTKRCYRPLVTGCPPVGSACAPGIEEHADVPPGTVFGGGFGESGECTSRSFVCGPRFEGATPDLRHVVLLSEAALVQGAGAGLYEWSAGKLAFIGEGEMAFISDDGSITFFTVNEGGVQRLFVHDSAVGAGETGETIAIGGPVNSKFLAASGNGSKAFFTQEGKLDECEVTVTAGKLACNLSSPAAGGEIVGMLGASKDGTSVYFASGSVLTNVANTRGEQAVNGSCRNQTESLCNLYVAHDGRAGWEAPILVAVLSGEDNPDWADPKNPGLESHTARVSPNGDWLTFMSQRGLTGNSNRDAASGQSDEEVYLYNAASSAVTCASCNPTGARPVGTEYNSSSVVGGDRVWPTGKWIAANIPGWTPFRLDNAKYQSRYLSESGRLFFNSSDALVPQDVNGTEDVYEYEPPGVGGCSTSSVTFSERSGGCVDLISSGTSGEESGFLDASETGGDVFFLTTAKLASRDFDSAFDVYDAHECAPASPCVATPGASPPPCVTGDACKSAPTPQPAIFGAPSSATFSGAGNVTPPMTASVVRTKTSPRAHKLERALRQCRMKRARKRRAVCEQRARKQYVAVNTKKRGK